MPFDLHALVDHIPRPAELPFPCRPVQILDFQVSTPYPSGDTHHLPKDVVRESSSGATRRSPRDYACCVLGVTSREGTTSEPTYRSDAGPRGTLAGGTIPQARDLFGEPLPDRLHVSSRSSGRAQDLRAHVDISDAGQHVHPWVPFMPNVVSEITVEPAATGPSGSRGVGKRDISHP